MHRTHSIPFLLGLIIMVPACQGGSAVRSGDSAAAAEAGQVVLPACEAKITPPFELAKDPESLHGSCIDVPKGVGHGKEGGSGPIIDNGWADFAFEVDRGGMFELWARVVFRDSDSNSFFVKLDNGAPHLLADDTWNRWHWVRLKEEISLEKGRHAMQVRNREDGVRLDEVRLIPEGLDASALLPKTWMEKLEVMGPEAAAAELLALYQRMTPVRPPRSTDTREAWEARRAAVRKEVLEDIGLDPMPEGVPLDPHIVATLKREGYTLSRLYFQLFPGCYGSAWLYVPDRLEGRTPAILNPHGHWTNRAYEATPQMRMIALAKKGYIALMTDNIHAGDLETGMCPIGLMTWQNLRALDYLLGREDVDPNRLGITGASGGGQQAMYLMGLDDRLRAAVPVVMASYFERILTPDNWHCWCNHAPGIAAETDTVEILCAFAPRPAFFICSSQDWTAKFPYEEYEEVKKVWALYGAADRTGCIISDEPHGYEQPRREAMYRFMNEHLGVADPDEGREPEITPEPIETLREMDKPFEGLWEWKKAVQWYREHHRPSAPVSEIPGRIARLIRSVQPEPGETGAEEMGTLDHGSSTLELLLVRGEGGLRLPALFIKAKAAAKAAAAVVLLLPEGKQAAFKEKGEPSPLVASLLSRGIHVLALDARLTGELARNWERNCLIWGRPEAGMAADDARFAAAYLAARDDVDASRISVLGLERMGVSALLAATLDRGFAACVFDGMERCYEKNPLHDADGYCSGDKWLFELGLPVIPRILDVADLPEIVKACPARTAVIHPGEVPYEKAVVLDAEDVEGLADFLAGRPSGLTGP